MGTNGDNLRLGNVEGGVPLSFLLEFSVEPQEPETTLELDFELLADIPSESVRDHQIGVRHALRFVENEPVDSPPSNLVAAVQAWNFHQMNDNVWSDIDQGNFPRATARMSRLTHRLMEAGHTRIAQQLRAETERLAAGAGISAEGRKNLTFATRSLVTRTVRFKTSDDEQL